MSENTVMHPYYYDSYIYSSGITQNELLCAACFFLLNGGEKPQKVIYLPNHTNAKEKFLKRQNDVVRPKTGLKDVFKTF